MKKCYILLLLLLFLPTHIKALEPDHKMNSICIGATIQDNDIALTKISGKEKVKTISNNSVKETLALIVNRHNIINITWIVLTVGYFIFNYFKNDKERRSNFKMKYYREFPDDYGPETVEYLMKEDVTPASLSAIILSIIYKKGFEISEKILENGKKTYVLIAGKTVSNENLTELEIFVKTWLIESFGYGGDNLEEIKEIKEQGFISDPSDIIKIDIENIETVYKDEGEACKFNSKYEDWSLRARINGAKEDFFEKNINIKVFGILLFAIGLVIVTIEMIKNAPSLLFLFSFIVYFALNIYIIVSKNHTINHIISKIYGLTISITLLITNGILPEQINDSNLWSSIIYVMNIFLLTYIITFNKRTMKGNDHYVKWMAFKRFLLDFSSLNEKEMPEVYLWEKYLVYATALGIADKVSDDMQIRLPEMDIADTDYPTINLDYIYDDLTQKIDSILLKTKNIITFHDSKEKSLSESNPNEWLPSKHNDLNEKKDSGHGF